MNTPHASKRWFRFTIAGLIFVTSVVAATLVGYRIGFDQGYAGGYRKRQSERPFAKVYRVADLLIPQGADPSTAIAGFDPLIELITSTIEPGTWDEVGGPGTVEPFPNNSTLVITQTHDVHDEIEDVFRQLRESGTSTHANE